ncbi:hypothetical protein PENSPDRAFT_291523 [Peniophora sp. CONT]|nr:hypothetical protein PENSPDRAFT_291523 [Peniophora sp. CONT]
MLTAALSGLSLATAYVLAAPYADNVLPFLTRRDDPDQVSKMTHSYSSSVGWTNSKDRILAVTGDIQLPGIKLLAHGGNISASAWVQLDGDSCKDNALMVGIDMTTNDAGVSTVYEAWTAVFPGPGKVPIRADNTGSGCSNLSFAINDTITLSVNTTGSGPPLLMVSNKKSPGAVCTPSLSATPSLCNRDASWHLGRTDNNASALVNTTNNDLLFANAFASYLLNATGVDSSNATAADGGNMTVVSVGPSGSALDVDRQNITDRAQEHRLLKSDVDISCMVADDKTVKCHQKNNGA